MLFHAALRTPRAEFADTVVEDRTYKCPVCANFDTYSKDDHFYDD